jgi:hypothetical protein
MYETALIHRSVHANFHHRIHNGGAHLSAPKENWSSARMWEYVHSAANQMQRLLTKALCAALVSETHSLRTSNIEILFARAGQKSTKEFVYYF